MKPVRVTLVPLVVAAAALFVILPRTGGDVVMHVTGDEDAFKYEPSAIDLSSGDRLRAVNDTQVTHTVTAADGSFDLVLQPGQSRFVEVEDGRYEFYCRFHGGVGGLTGVLSVGNVPSPSISPSASEDLVPLNEQG